MIGIDQVPESLHEWWRLNEECDRLSEESWTSGEVEKVYGAIDAFDDRIRIAWEEAPRLDRIRVDWRYFKHLWRTRSEPR